MVPGTTNVHVYLISEYSVVSLPDVLYNYKSKESVVDQSIRFVPPYTQSLFPSASVSTSASRSISTCSPLVASRSYQWVSYVSPLKYVHCDWASVTHELSSC